MAFQVGSALLEACVLAIVKNEDVYGYTLTQRMKEAFDVSESTFYPILRRLQKDGFLETYDVLYSGRLRRYYRITKLGLSKHEEYWHEWCSFKDNIDNIMTGGHK